MEWLEVLLLWVKLMAIFTTIVFALIGIGKVYGEYRESRWQEKYRVQNNEMREKIERTGWEEVERLKDRLFLFEEFTKENGLESSIDKINRIISEINYDDRHNTWKKNKARWVMFPRLPLECIFRSNPKIQSEFEEAFRKYEEQRKQELRMKLGIAH